MCRPSRCLQPDLTSARLGRPAATLACLQVMDSCCERECFEDLQVFFDEKDQIIIDNSVLVKNPTAVLEAVNFEVEPIPLQPGCFAVDMAMRFRVSCDAFLARDDRPHRINGTTYVQKRDILFGGESSARVFSSDGESFTSLPRASIRAEPVVLSCKLSEVGTRKAVLITMGVFSVTSLERPALATFPVLERLVAERNCASTAENAACDVFDNMRFPTEQFCPGSRRNSRR